MLITRCFRYAFLAAVGVGAGAAASLAGPASAQDVVATFDDWTVYSYVEAGRKVCYVGSHPAKEEGTFRKRSDPIVLVAHRGGEAASEAATEEVSVTSGYPYKEKSQVTVEIGDNTFSLFTLKEWAWTKNAAGDREIVSAMVRGSTMTVRGESRFGTSSVDTYSLKGFTAARKSMADACK